MEKKQGFECTDPEATWWEISLIIIYVKSHVRRFSSLLRQSEGSCLPRIHSIMQSNTIINALFILFLFLIEITDMEFIRLPMFKCPADSTGNTDIDRDNMKFIIHHSNEDIDDNLARKSNKFKEYF